MGKPASIDLSGLPPSLHVGTSSFSSADWYDVFYPGEISPSEFLTHYGRTFRTVEIDATWHFMPGAKTVDAWARKVPDGFTFAAKVPKVITHEKLLEGCEDDWSRFIGTMDRLGPKLGPLLFQFQYVAKRADAQEYETGDRFRHRLESFMRLLPAEHRYVVEVRNPKWLGPKLTDLLRSRNIAHISNTMFFVTGTDIPPFNKTCFIPLILCWISGAKSLILSIGIPFFIC